MQDKDNLNQLKGLVSNQAQWAKFVDYLEFVIRQQHRTMEQSDSVDAIRRAQGAIYQLRRLQMLREEVLKNG
jgi:hypothetical protein